MSTPGGERRDIVQQLSDLVELRRAGLISRHDYDRARGALFAQIDQQRAAQPQPEPLAARRRFEVRQLVGIGILLAVVGGIVAAAASSGSSGAPTAAGTAQARIVTTTVPATTSVPPIPVGNQTQACRAWRLIWPAIDQATLDANFGPLEHLTVTGGPRQAFYDLNDWAQVHLQDGDPNALTDAVAAVVNSIDAANPSPQTLRANADIVNELCGVSAS